MVDAAILNQNDERWRAEADEVVIDDIPVPTGSIIESFTSRFESKLTFGDYSKDSDQLLSTWVQSNWSGGMLIDHHIEGGTDQRGRWAKAWTMSSEQLALPPKHSTSSFGAAILGTDADARGPISMPLIEIRNVLYVAMGKELWKITAPVYFPYNTDYAPQQPTYTKVADLPGYAQGKAILGSVDQFLYIPCGVDGVVVFRSHTHPTNPDELLSTHPDVTGISMEWWDGKQFALTLDGYLRVNYPATGWDAASPQMKIPSDEEPRGLELFYDQAGNEAIYIVTNKRMWAYDHEVGKIYPSTLSWPKHHNTGLGFTSWRDDALYVSSGFAVTRYTRDGVRTDVGLDRDDGIPTERILPLWGDLNSYYTGSRRVNRPARAITSMCGAQNFIVAAVQLGGRTRQLTDNSPYAICVWNEAGWHVLVEDALPYIATTGAGRYPVGLYVTEEVGGYRIWWGEGAAEHQGGSNIAAFIGTPTLHSIAIPRSFHSPRQQVLDQISEFETEGYYETGWFDAGMEGFQKTWSHIEVNIADPNDGLPMGGTVEVQYRTDDDPTTWNTIGTVTDYGRNVLKFGVDGAGVPRGVTSSSIEFRFNLSTNMPSRSPIISSFVLKFIKLALPGRAWQITAPLDSEQWKGMGPSELSAWLARMTYEGGFAWLMVRDKKRRVRVSQVQRVMGTGDNPYEQVQINLIEVTIPGDPDWGGEE